MSRLVVQGGIERPLHTVGSAGRAVVSAGTIASARTVLGAASAGDGIFQIGTIASVRTFIGAASTSAATTASAGIIELATTAEAIAGTDATRAMTPATHAAAAGDTTLETEQATTSGTAFDFTGISSDAVRITVIFNEITLSGTDQIWVQIGDSGGISTSGYLSTVANIDASPSVANTTSAFTTDAGLTVSGHLILTSVDSAGLTWIASGTHKSSTTRTFAGGGSKTLSNRLDRVRITRSGTDTFTAGSVNIIVDTQ